MNVPVKEAARNKWLGILPEFGIDTKYLRNTHGPCPICDGSDRFRFDDKGGEGTFYCNQCGAGNGFTLVMAFTGLEFKAVANRIDNLVGNIQATESKPKTDIAANMRRLRKIGSELNEIQVGDPAWRYLRNRGFENPVTTGLKVHPGLTYFEQGQAAGTYPAMVAPLRNANGKIITLHLTYITATGQKAPVRTVKKILPTIGDLTGCAIRLGDQSPANVSIAEGIETALSVTTQTGEACWATYSANNMATFNPPESVHSIRFYADSDKSFTGQAAAFTGASRLVKNYKVSVADLLPLGYDFHDLMNEGETCAA